MVSLSHRRDSIPLVNNKVDRLRRFPRPTEGDRCRRLDSGTYEIYDGARWVTEIQTLDQSNIVDPTAEPYNATGDGATNDSVAFLAAALAAVGGTLMVPAGDYLLGNVDLPAGTTIVMDDRATIMVAPGSAYGLKLADTSVVYGGRSNGAFLTGEAPAITSDGADDLRVMYHTVESSGGRGLDFKNATRVRVQSCLFSAISSVTIAISGSSSQVGLDDNVFVGVKHAIQIYGSDPATVSEESSVWVNGVTIASNTIACSGNAIWVVRARNYTVTGNTVIAAGNVGIEASGSVSGTIGGNEVANADDALIRISYDCTGLTIAGNTLDIAQTTRSTHYGIHFASAGVDRGYHRDIVVDPNVIRASSIGTEDQALVTGIKSDPGIFAGQAVGLLRNAKIAGNVLVNCRIYLVRAIEVDVERNRISLRDLLNTTTTPAIWMSGCQSFTVEHNKLTRPGDSGTTRAESGIYLEYLDAAGPNELYAVVSNRVNGWTRSIADEALTAGVSRARIESNGVSGSILRKATGFIGIVTGNYSITTPSSAVSETTY